MDETTMTQEQLAEVQRLEAGEALKLILRARLLMMRLRKRDPEAPALEDVFNEVEELTRYVDRLDGYDEAEENEENEEDAHASLKLTC